MKHETGDIPEACLLIVSFSFAFLVEASDFHSEFTRSLKFSSSKLQVSIYPISACFGGNGLPGIHQLHLPSKRIVAGTSSDLMIVASTRTAIAIPKPISLVTTIEVNAKAPHTITNKRAAFVITPPVFDNPRATDQRLFCVSNHSSRIRLKRKTS